ncbi:MAG TPA: hypothetical protein VL069_03775 [Opitutus sp.]|nr:hypothetical protein [Opitutus sp.]
MIGLSDIFGTGPDEQQGHSLYLCALGATARKGRLITPAIRQLAKALAETWDAGADSVKVISILNALHLAPDDVLPPDDSDLAEVLELGRHAEGEIK